MLPGIKTCFSMSSNIVSAKFEADDIKLLKKIVKFRGEDTSSFVRRAVRLELARLGYLPKEESKALGREVMED